MLINVINTSEWVLFSALTAPTLTTGMFLPLKSVPVCISHTHPKQEVKYEQEVFQTHRPTSVLLFGVHAHAIKKTR